MDSGKNLFKKEDYIEIAYNEPTITFEIPSLFMREGDLYIQTKKRCIKLDELCDHIEKILNVEVGNKNG